MRNRTQINYPHIVDYCEQYSTKPEEIFSQITETTKATVGMEVMLTGAHLGMFLRMMTMLAKPKTILEIGTFTGYGTQNFVKGMIDGGTIYTIDNEAAHQKIAQEKVVYPDNCTVEYLLGPALEILSTWTQALDLVFIDAAKRQYSDYFDLVVPHLNRGGIILADNVLWKGLVGSENNDKLGSALDRFNQKVYHDDRVLNVLIPIDDGIHFIMKKD